MENVKYVISFGTVKSGFTITGPFEYIDDATDYAKLHYPEGSQWEVLPLEAPST